MSSISIILLNNIRYAVMVGVVLGAFQIASAQDIRDRVIAEWRKLDKETKVTSLVSQAMNNGKPMPLTRFAIQGDLQKVERGKKAYLSSSYASYVLAKNANGGWTVEHLSNSDRLFNEELTRNMAICVGNISLLDAISDSNFEFVEWQKVGEKIVFEVRDLKEIELRKSKTPHKPSAFASVKVTVDPNNLCRIVSTEENGEWKELKASILQDYQYKEDRFVPSAINRTSTVSNGNVLTLEQTISQVSHERLPESEFSLEFYGLKSIYTKPWPSKLWFLVFAIPLGLFVCLRLLKYIRTGLV